MSDLDFEQRHRLEAEVLPAVISDPEYAASTIVRLDAEIERLREVLEIIERWKDFPESDHTWGDGTPMSYGAAFGSIGERDYMRGIARAALAGKEDA